MTDIPMVQSSFNAGVLSPQVYGRVDIDRYPNACKTLLNMIPLVQGPAERRPGTEYIATVKDSTKAVRLIPFEYSKTQAYVLEFGDLYIRFFKDGGQIAGGELVTNGGMELDANWSDLVTPTTNERSTEQQAAGLYSRKLVSAATDDGIESDAFSVVAGETLTFIAYVYSATGDDIRVKLYGGDGSVLKNQDYATVASTWTLITFTALDAVGGALGQVSFSSPSGVNTWYVDAVSVKKDSIYELVSPYSEDELFDINFAQSADTMYLAHKDHEPKTLTRSGHDEWGIEDISWTDGPYLPENDTDITLDASAITGAITITASLPLFYSTDVGRLVSQKHGTTWGVAIITGWTSPTVVDATVIRNFAAHTINVAWKMGVWSETTGFPSLVMFEKERLVWAASDSYPQNLWGSKVGIYTDHGAGVTALGVVQDVTDSDAISVELGAKQVTPIMWLESLKRFVVGTNSIEWWIANATGDGPITATSKQAVKGSFNGSSKVPPIVADNVIIYVCSDSKTIRELYYSYDQDSFVGEDITIVSEHLTRVYGIVEMVFHRHPFKVGWIVRSDGALLGLTYDKTQEVKGLHLHTTDGKFRSVTRIPSATDDEIWFVVDRVVGGSTVKFIERLHSRFISDDLADAFFLDSGLSLDNRQTIDSITHADPGVINLVDHGYSDSDNVMFRTVDDSVSGEEEYDSLNYEEYEVAHKTAHTFRLHDADGNDVDLSEYKAVVSATVGKMVTSVSGLDHLEGKTVSILADGATEPDQEVDSGGITLSGNGASVVHAGLAYNSDLETLNPNAETRRGSIQGEPKKITTVLLKLYRTLGLNIGEDADNLNEYVFTSDDVKMGRSAEMLSGDTAKKSFNGKIETSVGIYVRQSEPLPVTISAIVYDIDSGDD